VSSHPPPMPAAAAAMPPAANMQPPPNVDLVELVQLYQRSPQAQFILMALAEQHQARALQHQPKQNEQVRAKTTLENAQTFIEIK
jgi:hypothetical protein